MKWLKQFMTRSTFNNRRHGDYFCADEENANICSDLILRGEKTATCSMKYWYEFGLEPMLKVGNLQVVADWNGNPTSIIEITGCFRVQVL